MHKTGPWRHFESMQPIAGRGCFRITHPLFPASRCAEVIADANAFFHLPRSAKQHIAIENSAHFRGYSEMRNDRDWREQIHFSREEPFAEGLRGPNLWPPDSDWRRRTLTLLADLEQVGREVLAGLAVSTGLPSERFLRADEQPYLLLKMILYQLPPSGVPRSG